ncbi:MAG TPA: phosphotransferase [Streptosporangiaceae bacterium]|nr:phosphotransferase [Streptosporangiaceae bacterium]
MRRDSIYDQTRAVLEAAAAHLGVPVHDARLLRLHSNANFALPSAGLVVRIATNPGALDRVAASIAVTRWLADRGFPCAVPAGIEDQPLVIAGHVVSVWRYVPTTDTPAPTGADIGRLLRDLHAQGDPPHPLRRLGDPFASVASAMEEAPDSVPEPSRSWLADRIASLRRQWSGMDFPLPAGLIHGDAHISNLMRATSGEVILGDWDHVATGPREWDLIQIYYMRRRFGRAGEDDIEAFTATYGWDIRSWPGLDTLVAIREITGLSPYIRTARTRPFSGHQLAYRLRTLQAGDTSARWESPPAE